MPLKSLSEEGPLVWCLTAEGKDQLKFLWLLAEFHLMAAVNLYTLYQPQCKLAL